MKDFGFKAVKDASGLNQARANVQLSVARHRMQKADNEFAGNRFNAVMKQAVGHGGIQQRGNNTPMKNAGISLKQRTALECASHTAIGS